MCLWLDRLGGQGQRSQPAVTLVEVDGVTLMASVDLGYPGTLHGHLWTESCSIPLTRQSELHIFSRKVTALVNMGLTSIEGERVSLLAVAKYGV